VAIKRGKLELIDTGKTKRYTKRNQDGTFKESVDVGKSLAVINAASPNQLLSLGTGIRGTNQSAPQRRVPRKPPRRNEVSELHRNGADAAYSRSVPVLEP
jgi:hypothetical protein